MRGREPIVLGARLDELALAVEGGRELEARVLLGIGGRGEHRDRLVELAGLRERAGAVGAVAA